MLRRCLWLALASLLSSACGGPQAEPTFADPDDPAYAAAQDGHTDARISRSEGEAGGTVVLWPRVVPSEGAGEVQAQAQMVQDRLREFAEAEGHPVDVRPEPERVCPRSGCVAAAVGAVLFHVRGGCAVVATTALPGRSATHIERWGGEVDVLNANPPFREPPEQFVRVHDLMPCDQLGAAMAERDEMVQASVSAIRRD